MSIEHVGLIGAGLMGHGITANILKHDYRFAFLAHPGNRPTGDLVAAGAVEARTIDELVGRSDVILVCVTGSPQVEAVLTGSEALVVRRNDGHVGWGT